MTICARCDDPIDECDLSLEVEGARVHVDCIDEGELGEIAVRQQANLAARDAFIVQRGLWHKFTSGLASPLSAGEGER